MKYSLNILFCITLFFSCSSETIVEDEENPVVLVCKDDLNENITAADNKVDFSSSTETFWKAEFDENFVRIFFTANVGNEAETETFNFLFNKTENCINLERAYKFYDGKEVDVSAITEIRVDEFYIKEYTTDEFFSGLIVYQDPHDKETYSRKIWVDLTPKTTSNQGILTFDNCFGDKLPIEIDMNSDGTIDYKLDFEINEDIGNTPKFKTYTIKLISTDDSINEILSPLKNQSPYSVVFEPPFSSQNTRQYFNGVKNELDVFYEFDSPYESYNYFLNNNLTYSAILNNNKEDYFLVKMSLNNEEFYGWIRFELNTSNCEVEVKSTFLNPIASRHVTLN